MSTVEGGAASGGVRHASSRHPYEGSTIGKIGGRSDVVDSLVEQARDSIPDVKNGDLDGGSSHGGDSGGAGGDGGDGGESGDGFEATGSERADGEDAAKAGGTGKATGGDGEAASEDASGRGLPSEVETPVEMLLTLLGDEHTSPEDKEKIMAFLEEFVGVLDQRRLKGMADDLRELVRGRLVDLTADADMTNADLLRLAAMANKSKRSHDEERSDDSVVDEMIAEADYGIRHPASAVHTWSEDTHR